MTTPTFAQPEYAGSGYEIGEHKGHLVAYVPAEYQTGIVTKFTKPGAAPSDAVKANVICVDCEHEYRDVLAFQARIIGVTKNRIGEVVLGRLGQSPSQSGFDAWELQTFTPDDATRATDYWNRRTTEQFQQPAPTADTGHKRSLDTLKQQLGAQVI